MPALVRGVFDTNVVLAAKLSTSGSSPAAEILDRWENREFTFLFSTDILLEYAAKLRAKAVPPGEIAAFIRLLVRIGEPVQISSFHFRQYPVDPDDVMFLLCALNGAGTHLVTYDPHLLSLRPAYASDVAICRPLEFLADCRKADASSP